VFTDHKDVYGISLSYSKLKMHYFTLKKIEGIIFLFVDLCRVLMFEIYTNHTLNSHDSRIHIAGTLYMYCVQCNVHTFSVYCARMCNGH